MKLLGWMHHKLRLRKIEPFKDLTIGNYCNCLSVHLVSLNDRDSHPKSTSGHGYSSRYSSLSQQDSFTEFEGGREEDSFGHEASTVISGRFHGFLTIGTLGSQRIIDEPVTPTFTMSSDNLTEERPEVTENALKLVDDELGRFLAAQAKEQGSDQTSERNSLVSTIQEANAEEYGKTRFEVKKEKVFNDTRIAEENPIEKCGKEENQAKQTNKPVKHLIKKILNKFHVSSESSSASHKETKSFSTKIKLQKVIKLFHKKIHPENSIDENIEADQIQQAQDNMRLPQNITSKVPSYGIIGYPAASENGEHWINKDADYLVLEL